MHFTRPQRRKWLIAALVAFASLVAGCQSTPGPLAKPDEPHGVLVSATPPAGLQPIEIAYIDDRKVGGRQSYWVTPGTHRIRSRMLSGDFARTLKSGGPDKPDATQGELVLDVEAGYRYLLVGEVTANRAWRVFVLRKEPLQAADAANH